MYENSKNSTHDRSRKNQEQDKNNSYQTVYDDDGKIHNKPKYNPDSKFLNFLRISPKNATFIAFCIIALASILYIITLKGCPKAQAECLKEFDQTLIKYFVMALFSSAFLYAFIYLLIFYKWLPFYIFFINTAIIIVLFICDTGTDLKSHGQFNRNFLIIFMLLSIVIQFILRLVFLIMEKVGIVRASIIIVIIASVLGYSLHIRLMQNCNNWSKGLGDTEIDNSNGCQIKEPKYCWMNFMDNVFDISGWMGENCEQIRMDDRAQVLRWTRVKNAKRIGYPRYEKYNFFPDSTLDVFQFKVLHYMIDMDDPRVPQSIKDNVEVMVDYTLEPAEMLLRVRQDLGLVKARAKIRSSLKSQKFIAKNVLYFFIDSLSRDNLKRKLPKTLEFLEKHFRNKNTKMQSYQMLKYHALASWTFANQVPVNFGVESTHVGSPVHHNKFFKQNGFITGNTHNYCGRDYYDIENGNIEKFRYESFDHESQSLSCDPNFSVPGHPYAMLNGSYGMKRRCLYGKDLAKHVFEYTKKFWSAYKEQPKFFRMSFIDAHEGTAEVVKYMDDHIMDFFEYFEAENNFEDTVIILQSDHGVNMPGFYTFVDAEDFSIEKSLPSMYMIVPQNVATEYDEILKSKENLMVTPYDLHNTLLHLGGAPKTAYNKLGESYFKKTEKFDERTCDWFKVIDPFCQCANERDY